MADDGAGARAARTERDALGEVRVPAGALWGAATQRALENFPVSGERFPRRFLEALGWIKAAAAFSSPSARRKRRGKRSPLTGKFATARAVEAPHNASAGTATSPSESRRVRVAGASPRDSIATSSGTRTRLIRRNPP